MNYTLSNPILPGDTYQYDITTNTARLLQHLPLPSALQENDMTIDSRVVETTDHQFVPFTVVAPAKASAATPVLLSSYGCYGVDNSIHYHPPFLSLLRRGWMLGYPAIRLAWEVRVIVEAAETRARAGTSRASAATG